MNIVNYAVFPSIITEIECDFYQHICDPLIDWIYQYQKTTETVILSNRGGWQSPSDFWQQESFLEFKNYILTNAFSALRYYNLEFNLSNMWININKKGDYNVSHNHPGATMSGVFWVKTSPKCGPLVFDSPNNFTEFKLIKKIDNNMRENFHCDMSFVFGKPKPGIMVLFPSHLKHFVEPNESDEDRISIAFNLNT